MGSKETGKTRMPQCLEDAKLGGHSKISVIAWVGGADLSSERYSYATSGLRNIAPCTGTMLRRDRVAVAVANDDVLKRLVHAKENARPYLSVLLEGRRLWG